MLEEGVKTYERKLFQSHVILEYQPQYRCFSCANEYQDNFDRIKPNGISCLAFPYLIFVMGDYMKDYKTHIDILCVLFSNRPTSELTISDYIYCPPLSNIDFGKCGICMGECVDGWPLERAVTRFWHSQWSYGAYSAPVYDQHWAKDQIKWRDATPENVTQIEWGDFKYSEKFPVSDFDKLLQFGG